MKRRSRSAANKCLGVKGLDRMLLHLISTLCVPGVPEVGAVWGTFADGHGIRVHISFHLNLLTSVALQTFRVSKETVRCQQFLGVVFEKCVLLWCGRSLVVWRAKRRSKEYILGHG